MSLVIDTSALIDLYEYCPDMLNDEHIMGKLISKIKNQEICLLDVVIKEFLPRKEEKIKKDSSLEQFILSMKPYVIIFDKTEDAHSVKVLEAYKAYITKDKKHTIAILEEFKTSVDSKIILHALRNNYPVLSSEKLMGELSAPGSIRRVKIPNVCKSLGIKYLHLADFTYALTKEVYQSRSNLLP